VTFAEAFYEANLGKPPATLGELGCEAQEKPDPVPVRRESLAFGDRGISGGERGHDKR
jgi:hypothetical protein